MRQEDLTAKQKALFKYLGEDENLLEEITDFDDSTDYFYIEGETLLILTDEEAEEKARDSLESIIEDQVLSQIPNSLQGYFDTDKYIDDVLRFDGRGATLAGYDENENEYYIDGEYIYIYRN